MDNYITYILQSESTGRYYIGHTHDIETRLYQHNNHLFRGSISTRRLKGPWRLVYYEEYSTRSEAMMREKQIKSWKRRKSIDKLITEKLVESRHSVLFTQPEYFMINLIQLLKLNSIQYFTC